VDVRKLSCQGQNGGSSFPCADVILNKVFPRPAVP
jgi:hypothetical protein